MNNYRKMLIFPVLTIIIVVFAWIIYKVYSAQDEPNDLSVDSRIIVPIGDVRFIPYTITTALLREAPSVELNKVPSSSYRAVLISKETIILAKTNPEILNILQEIVRQQKILIVYNISPNEVAKTINISLQMTTDMEAKRLFSSVAYINNTPVLGGIVASNDNPQSDDDLTKHLKQYVQRILEEKQRMDSMLSIYPNL